MEKKKSYNIFKATLWYTISNVLVKGVAFFVLPIFTRLMTTEEYGIYSIYMSYMAIAEVVVLFGLSSTVRIAKYDKQIDCERYLATIIYIPPILSLLFAVPLNIALLFTHEFLSMSAELWNYMLITIAFAAIGNIVCGKLVIDGKYKLYTIYSLLLTLLNVGLSLLLCYTAFKSDRIYMARVIGVLVSQVVAAIVLLIFSKTIRKIDIRYVKQAIIWGVPLLLHTLATVVLTQTDKIIIQFMDGFSAAGIYAIAVTFIAIPLVVYTSFENAWAPWFFEKLDEKNYDDIKKFNNVYIMVMCAIVCIFMLASPTLVRLFTEESYWNSIYCLIPLTASVFFEMLYGISVSVEYYYKKTWSITIGTLVTVTLNIGLDILFIYLWGYVAAAYATTISKLFLFLFHFFISKKYDKHSMFNLLIVGLLTAFMAGVTAASIFLVNVFWARLVIAIAILGIMIFLIIKNREILMMVLKSRNKKVEQEEKAGEVTYNEEEVDAEVKE